MRILGISSMFHDAAVSMVDSGEIVFAGHAERYSKKKNDPFLNHEIIAEALSKGKPNCVVLHETHWLKQLRHLASRNWGALREPSQEKFIREFYPELTDIPMVSYRHHETHAAAGILTSGFSHCAVIVIDAIGEFDTATIWHWHFGRLTRMHSIRFPSSMGLFYSAVTHRVGLKPMEDEYVLMGMAAYGEPERSSILAKQMSQKYFVHPVPNVAGEEFRMKKNLQRGLPDADFRDEDDFDLARAAQQVIEERLCAYARYARRITQEENLVYMGGVALNCSANSLLYGYFDNIHIMPNPGDAGSSLGGAALEYYRRTGETVAWRGPYLGHDIHGDYPVQHALESLRQGEIFGIANGRAEFGPRALGNRSLLADPRGGDIKDKVNEIKHRQKFRPFAPVILEHHAQDYFDMPLGKPSPYMQFVARCKYPDQYPAIVHRDNTSRVQTVNRDQHPGLFRLLETFYFETGCPMLLNTSLNIKGQPMVNDEIDAYAFSERYGIKVHTHD